MSMRSSIVRGLAAIVATLLLAACMNQPEPRHPGPYKAPVDAFNAVETPYDPSIRAGSVQPLTHDIAHLREARNAYKNSQAIQAARTKAKQQACRENPNARLVHIQDGTHDPDAVYCQSQPDKSDDSHGGN